MRSNAPASPCWARRMASASVISLVPGCLVRVTVPVGTHPKLRSGMHPWLLELHLFDVDCAGLVLVSCPCTCLAPGLADFRGRRGPLFATQALRWSRIGRKKAWNHGDEHPLERFQLIGRQGAEKRFQDDRGLPHARIQIVG